MTADFKKLIKSLEANQFSPVYLIDGEEPFYLDLITSYFEEKILDESQREFTLLVLYSNDGECVIVVNACLRFPMFADRQVVILKVATQLKRFNDLASYLESPAPTTIFL